MGSANDLLGESASNGQLVVEKKVMGKRDEQRKKADRDFEVARQGVATMPDAWLCDALREIPHRKRIEIEKGTTVGVGILSHRAADRIAELEREVRSLFQQMPCTCIWHGYVGPDGGKTERISLCPRCARLSS